MRVASWRGHEVFDDTYNKAVDNANEFMDTVVEDAKRRCPPPGKTHIFRPPGFSSATVSFTPKTGRNKGQLVTFKTDKRWTGREPGNLKGTIRRVTKGGNLRIYAGNFLYYWAFMVERGTSSTGWGGPAAAQPFLRPAFRAGKTRAIAAIGGK